MYPFLFENRDFSSGLADRPHVSGENGHWKRIFSKNASQSGDFWKRRLLVYVKPKENRGFRVRWCHTSYTSSMTHASWGILSYFHCFSFYTWKGEKKFKYVTCGRVFFGKGGNKLPFQKYRNTYGLTLNLLMTWLLGSNHYRIGGHWR